MLQRGKLIGTGTVGIATPRTTVNLFENVLFCYVSQISDCAECRGADFKLSNTLAYY
jgi:hypothetical protein